MRLLGDVNAVAKEDEVEFCFLGLANHREVMVEIDRTIADRFRMTPGAHVAAGAGEECADSKRS